MKQICYLARPHVYENLMPGEIYLIYRETNSGYILEDDDTVYEKSQFFIYDPKTCLENYDMSEWEEFWGDWTIPELGSDPDLKYRGIDLRRLTPLLTEDRVQEIDFDDIQWFGFDMPSRLTGFNCVCCGGERTRDANLNYLGVLMDGTTTYSGRRYRCMDGRHRIEKQRSMGLTKSKFYVFNFDELKDYYLSYDWIKRHPDDDPTTWEGTRA